MIKRLLFYSLLFLIHIDANAQNDKLAEDVHNAVISAVNTFNGKDFYFIGQAHGNMVNTLLEKEFLFALNRKYGVRYEILEYGHSLAVIFNEYIESGNDSLLTYISPGSNFTLLKAVKHFNDSADEQHRIKFYGIDFEGRLGNKYLKKAIEIMLAHIRPGNNDALHTLMNKLMQTDSAGTKETLLELKKYLLANETESRKLSGKFYTDLLLIANARYGFSPRRDDEMYANFKLLYKELARPGQHPKFFASFGYAHLNPNNKPGIVNRLLNNGSSPVYGKVSLTGVEYFNSSFSDNIKKTWDGNLNKRCINKGLNILKSKLKENPGVSFLSRDELNALDCSPVVQKFDGLLFIYNTGKAGVRWD